VGAEPGVAAFVPSISSSFGGAGADAGAGSSITGGGGGSASSMAWPSSKPTDGGGGIAGGPGGVAFATNMQPRPLPFGSSPNASPGTAASMSPFEVAGALAHFSPVVHVSSASNADKAAQELLLRHLQEARARLAEIECERRELMDSSLSAMAACSPESKAAVVASAPVGGAAPPSGLVCMPWTGLAPTASSLSASPSSVAAASAHSPKLHRAASSPGSLVVAMAMDADAPNGLAISNGQSPEKPQWLLADGRLFTARLEGENEALKRALSRSLVEIDELESRRTRCDALSKALAMKNASAEQVSRALRFCSGSLATGASSTSSVSALAAAKTQGAPAQQLVPSVGSSAVESSPLAVEHRRLHPVTPDAAAILRRMVLGGGEGAGAVLYAPGDGSSVGSQSLCGLGDGVGGDAIGSREGVMAFPQHQQQQQQKQQVLLPMQSQRMARDRLLETSLQVEKRMQEILSRRGGKLQAVLKGSGESIASANPPSLAEQYR